MTTLNAERWNYMFEIDLLKGQGVPIKSRPGGIALATIPFIVPAVVAMIMFVIYTDNKGALSAKQGTVSSLERKIEAASASLRFREAFDSECRSISRCLTEVAGNIHQYVQWSGVLESLVKNMPDSIALNRLEVKSGSARRNVRQRSGSTKKEPSPVRTLQINVYGSSRDGSDRAVQDFLRGLRSSNLPASRITEVGIVAQKRDSQDKDIIYYDIDCIFKSEQ